MERKATRKENKEMDENKVIVSTEMKQALVNLRNLEEIYVIMSGVTKMPFVLCDEETFDDEVLVYYQEESAKEKAKSSVSDFKRGMVQEQQSRQTGQLEKQQQRRQNIADKRMELQKAQEARQAQRKADGSATTGATRPHERPATASTIPKPSAEKMQEVKRPATATTSKASEPVKTNVIKERPLSSGASDKKATQSAQPVHRQNVEKVVSQETRQNDTKDRRIKVQQTQTVQKNQQTIEKTRNLVTKKGQKKK